MPGRYMADITLQHLILTDFLAFILLRAVIVILMDHGTAAVVAQLRSFYRRAFKGLCRISDMNLAKVALSVI